MFEEVSDEMSWGRDSLRVRLTPARSIEETGLDPSLYGSFLSPHGALSPHNDAWNKALLGIRKTNDFMGTDENNISAFAPPAKFSKCQLSLGKVKSSFENASDIIDKDVNSMEVLSEHGRGKLVKRGGFMKGRSKMGRPINRSFQTGKQATMVRIDETSSDVGNSGGLTGDSADIEVDCSLQEFLVKNKEKRNSSDIEGADANFETIPEAFTKTQVASCSLKHKMDEQDESCGGTQEILSRASGAVKTDHTKSPNHVCLSTFEALLPSEVAVSETAPLLNGTHSEFNTSGSVSESAQSAATSASMKMINDTDSAGRVSDGISMPSVTRKLDARSRWKRATNTVKLVNHMAATIKSASADLIEHKALDEISQQQSLQDDAGGVGAAAFEGAKTLANSRRKGRKGMEGLLVRQDRQFVTYFQDFYVAFLKMPISHFLIGVFLAPVALGLLFTPLYLLDVNGLNGVVPEDATTGPFVSAAQGFLAFLNIFLYALSLSTTFGGSPVAARSPFCLLVANVNTLMAQFLFVFLSGAVFARMSQPSYPIRCAKKAIIKTDDLVPVLGLEEEENYKVFCLRLVLTGPSPCELIDAKICLTFRIFVNLPSGSVFCSTQELEVVHSEVPYLRYGLMVRHIIDKKSPVYGHTIRSLQEGDASFSLSVMGMERSSMQPVFHLEDYFVCDGDVIWDGDYVDFIHINKQGQRVLDHSLIDGLKPMRAATEVSQATSRMKKLNKLSRHTLTGQKDHGVETESNEDMTQAESSLSIRNLLSQIRKRNLFKLKSTSFTRAVW